MMRTCTEADFSVSLVVCTGKKKSGRNYIYCEFSFYRAGECIRREIPAGKYDDCVKLYEKIAKRNIPLSECKAAIEAL